VTAVERYRLMARLREFDLACLEGVPTGEIHGELHTGIGQEGIAAGLAGALREGDALVSTHRNHYHALVKGVSPRGLLAEIYERATGLCGGFGGHMHPFDPGHRFSASGIVGASLPVALGYAYAFAIEGGDRLAIGVTGDGGANHGTFHECLNIAAAWELPLVVLVENNRYAISVEWDDVRATETVAERAGAYGAVGAHVDGTDAEAVARVAERVLGEVRRHSRPAILEATCARFQGHYEGDPQTYRSEAARALDRQERDPILRARRALLDEGRAGEAELDEIYAAARREMRELLAAVRRDPRPDPATAHDHVFVAAPGS
jgi:pyruvate dehydrogenase E1 component alpha subunit